MTALLTPTAGPALTGGLRDQLTDQRNGFTTWSAYENACALLARGLATAAAAGQERETRWGYATAHLAAIRVAAAVLAVRGKPKRGRGAVNVWAGLRAVAPELSVWVQYFEASARCRAVIESGRAVEVTTEQVTDLLANVAAFHADVSFLLDVE